MREESVNEFINSRYCLLTMAVVAIGMSYFFNLAGIGAPTVSKGLLPVRLAVGTYWIFNVLMVFAVALVMRVLDKNFVFVREYTVIYAAYFVLAAMSGPDYSVGWPVAAVANAVLLLCVLILFGGYQQRERRQFLFLVAFILSLCSMFDYVFILYVPAFVVGFMQMKLFSFKGFVAILLGMAVPYWIVLGIGAFSLADLEFPVLKISKELYFQELRPHDLYRLALVLVVGTVLGVANMFKLISYRLQLRSYNGFFTVIAVYTLLLLLVDIRNFGTYLMTLNVCASYQVAHFFTIYKMQRGYVLFFILIIANIACLIPEIMDFFRL